MTTRRQKALGGFALAGSILLTLPQVAIGQDADEFTYWLEIDCFRSGFSNEGTRSDYMITGTSDDGVDYAFNYEEPDAQRLTDRNCVSGVAPFTVSFPERVSLRHIRIELLEGQFMDDALFLDFLHLAVVGPDLEDSIEWGANGADGWCLSADPDDSGGRWRGLVYDDVCYPCLEFSLVPITSDEQPIIDGDWSGTAVAVYSECPLAEGST
jgi:hypothetical protein